MKRKAKVIKRGYIYHNICSVCGKGHMESTNKDCMPKYVYCCFDGDQIKYKATTIDELKFGMRHRIRNLSEVSLYDWEQYLYIKVMQIKKGNRELHKPYYIHIPY